jgi:hypothetical protein
MVIFMKRLSNSSALLLSPDQEGVIRTIISSSSRKLSVPS